MAGRPGMPRGDREELLFYKGVYHLRNQIEARAKLANQLALMDKDIAASVVKIKRFITWKDLGQMLKMTELQAKTYLSPLMGEELNSE